MKRLIKFCLCLVAGVILTSCTTADEVVYDAEPYTVVYVQSRPYYRYYYGGYYHYYHRPPVVVHHHRNDGYRPHRPPRNHDNSRPQNHSGNRNPNPRPRR